MKKKRLEDEYAYPGFIPRSEVLQHELYPDAKIIILDRFQKKRFPGVAVKFIFHFTTARPGVSGIYPVGTPGYIWRLKYAAFLAGSVIA
jgi:hypothetical protein